MPVTQPRERVTGRSLALVSTSRDCRSDRHYLEGHWPSDPVTFGGHWSSGWAGWLGFGRLCVWAFVRFGGWNQLSYPGEGGAPNPPVPQARLPPSRWHGPCYACARVSAGMNLATRARAGAGARERSLARKVQGCKVCAGRLARKVQGCRGRARSLARVLPCAHARVRARWLARVLLRARVPRGARVNAEYRRECHGMS